jgi:hypothetical protein
MAKLYAIENKLVKIGNSYLGELPPPPETYYLFEGWDPNGTSSYYNSFGVYNFKINGVTPSINGANPTVTETTSYDGTLENAIGTAMLEPCRLHYGDDYHTAEYIKFKADSVSSVSFNMGVMGYPQTNSKTVKTRIYKVVNSVKTLIGEYTGSSESSTITINCTDA